MPRTRTPAPSNWASSSASTRPAYHRGALLQGSTNTGTHIGNLWTSTGTLLATAMFSGETASAGSRSTFPSPSPSPLTRPMSPRTTPMRVFYAADQNTLARGVDRAPMHASRLREQRCLQHRALTSRTSLQRHQLLGRRRLRDHARADPDPTPTPTPTNTPTAGPPTNTPTPTNTPVPATCPCTIWPNTAARSTRRTRRERRRGGRKVPRGPGRLHHRAALLQGRRTTPARTSGTCGSHRHAARRRRPSRAKPPRAGSRSTCRRPSRSPPTRPTSRRTTRTRAATRPIRTTFTVERRSRPAARAVQPRQRRQRRLHVRRVRRSRPTPSTPPTTGSTSCSTRRPACRRTRPRRSRPIPRRPGLPGTCPCTLFTDLDGADAIRQRRHRRRSSWA